MKFFSNKDRRAYQRIEKKFLVNFSQKKGIIPQKTFTKNISEGGLLIESSKALSLNAIIYLTLNLPELGELILEAQVVRCKKHGKIYNIGLAFFNIDNENKELILKELSKIQD